MSAPLVNGQDRAESGLLISKAGFAPFLSHDQEKLVSLEMASQEDYFS